MSLHSSLRDKFGNVYVTVLDNTSIPWRQLSLGDFIYYDELIQTNLISLAVLEEEIFKKCVLDPELIKDINNLSAGTVSTVVHNILQASGPTGIDQFNSLLDQKRMLVNSPLHMLPLIIARAFSAYKLEDIYAMDYDTFLLRLAQAESVLLQVGAIKEPISLVDTTPRKRKKNPIQPEQLKDFWEKQQRKPEKQKEFTPPDKSPIFDADKKPRIIKNLDKERVEIERTAQTEEDNALRAQMLRDAQVIYKDIMKNMEFYKKAK